MFGIRHNFWYVVGTMLSLILAAVLHFPANAAVVVAGSFEGGNYNGWINGGNTTNTYIRDTSWSAPGFPGNNPPAPTDGMYFAAFGAPTMGLVSQVLATSAATSFLVEFDLAIGDGGSNYLAVSWNGANMLVYADAAPSFTFAPRSFIAAGQGSDLLMFSFYNTASYWLVDNIRVSETQTSPVPEPASLVLLGFGLAALSLRRVCAGLRG